MRKGQKFKHYYENGNLIKKNTKSTNKKKVTEILNKIGEYKYAN